MIALSADRAMPAKLLQVDRVDGTFRNASLLTPKPANISQSLPVELDELLRCSPAVWPNRVSDHTTDPSTMMISP